MLDHSPWSAGGLKIGGAIMMLEAADDLVSLPVMARSSSSNLFGLGLFHGAISKVTQRLML